MDTITPEIAYQLGRLNQIPGRAYFSQDMKYRYILTRSWDSTSRKCNFLMMNPSTADEFKLDPTVRRCLIWAIKWGYSELIVTNLFAYRSTDVSQIYKVTDPIGPENDKYLLEIMEQCKDGLIVCAFGGNGLYLNRHWDLFNLADKIDAKLHYLKLNNDSTPSHPLYLPNISKPIPWDYKNAKTIDDECERGLRDTRGSIQ